MKNVLFISIIIVSLGFILYVSNSSSINNFLQYLFYVISGFLGAILFALSENNADLKKNKIRTVVYISTITIIPLGFILYINNFPFINLPSYIIYATSGFAGIIFLILSEKKSDPEEKKNMFIGGLILVSIPNIVIACSLLLGIATHNIFT
jgi:cytochrome bd-type quinol oxidase subunit 2